MRSICYEIADDAARRVRGDAVSPRASYAHRTNYMTASLEKDWRKTIVAPTVTLQQAIRQIDSAALQIALVVSGDDRLVGTLTDGDIRRGLLHGLELSSSVESIIFQHPMVVPPQLGREAVLQVMQANRLHHLPIVDDEGRVVGLHVLDELMAPKRRSNLMIIMAGGRGTRLMPYTERCPKPMLLVGGKPILEHIIDRGRAEGFDHFVLAIHYLGAMIQDHFGDGSRWDAQIEYVREHQPLGTAGAISLLPRRPDAPFVVSNGDVLTDVRYGELLDFHIRNNAIATMAVRLHEWQHPFGVVRTNGIEIVGFDEKPVSRTHISAGIYSLSPTALDALTSGEHCDMPSLFARVAERGGRTIVYPMHEPWLDVGRHDDLQSARTNVQRLHT